MTVYDNTPTVNVVILAVHDYTGVKSPGFVDDSFRGIVAIRRKDNDGWALPGGYQERPEQIRTAAAREVREETGIVVKPQYLDLAGILTTPDGNVNLVFWKYTILLAEYQEAWANFQPNDEVSEIELKREPWITPFSLHTDVVRQVFLEKRRSALWL